MDSFQRLLLANQYAILALLDNANADSYRIKERALREGYEEEYSSLDSHWGIEPPVSAEACTFVKDVLDMFRVIYAAVNQLPAASQPPQAHWTFPGFDGNQETELLAYSRFLFSDDKWTELAGPNGDAINSHQATVTMYNRMLKAWNELPDKFNMDQGQLQTVLDAKNNP